MECRLCLRSVSEQSSVPIFGDQDSVQESIWRCCQLRVDNYVGLPNTICLLCDSNLKSLMDFKKLTSQSDAKSRLDLAECMNIKVEEVILDDEAPIDQTKSYKCDICSKSFERENYSIKHIRFQGERLHKCDACLKCKRQQTWIETSTFDCKEDALEDVAKEDTWSSYYQNKTADGLKKYYRCNKAKRKGVQCNAKLYMIERNKTGTVSIFKTVEEHSHGNDQSNVLSSTVKKQIEILFDLKIKPKTMFLNLTEQGYNLKNMRQLTNYLVQLRKQKCTPSKINLDELEQWCVDNSKLPDSDDTAFVVSYYVQRGDESSMEDEADVEKLGVFISTKRLLQTCSMSTVIHADTTYKLIWQNMPVLLVGTTDMNRHFHPFGMAVCSHETEKDFVFIFRSLIVGAKMINVNIDINCLVSDACNAIRNAFIDVFGADTVLIMCWAHMRRAVKKEIESSVKKTSRAEILSDIDHLHRATTTDVFERALQLFISKWTSIEDEFLVYMKLQWFTSHKNWYESAAHQTPSTNNALEAFNLAIKKKATFRERLPLAQFFNVIVETTHGWSKEYTNNIKVFNETVTVDLELWTKGYHWAKAKINILHYDGSDEYIVGIFPSNENSTVSMDDIRILNELRWESFDDYKNNAFNFWIVTLQRPLEDFTGSTCSCPEFMEKYLCKHVIGLSIRLNYIQPPAAVKQIPIGGEKRRRGRPKIATRALLVD